MNCWITTHWPPFAEVDPAHYAPEGVYVQDGKEDVIEQLRPGDRVWFYEAGHGRDELVRSAEGQSVRRRRGRGRQGIVCLAKVTASASSPNGFLPTRYANGTELWWRWYAPTSTLNSAGFVSRQDLAAILKYSPNYTFRGIGAKRSGLKRIDRAQHEAILQSYLNYQGEHERRLIRSASAFRRGAGGEGPVHKALKEYLAQDPSGVLGEEDLSLVEIEFAFGSTGDRIDVLLMDREGRYVAVEIEPDCPTGHEAGPLQCVKYRALLAYRYSRRPDEIRTVLATRSICDSVKRRASGYDIECKTISLP